MVNSNLSNGEHQRPDGDLTVDHKFDDSTESAKVKNGNQNAELIEETLIINSHKIGYCMFGNGSRKMLCICGGVGCYKKDFPEHVVKAFNPNDYTIVCIDPPGYGTSRPPDRKQEVNRCMKDASYCIELMKTLELVPFTVIGWSEGARTAIHVAGQGKQLVDSMVLMAAGTRVDCRGAGIFRGMRNTDQWLPDAIDVYMKYYSREFVTKQWADLCDVVQQVYELLGGRFPSDYILPSLKIPVLILTGGMDRFCADPQYFSKVLTNCRLERHSLGGHDFHLKYPRWFSDCVKSFLKDAKI